MLPTPQTIAAPAQASDRTVESPTAAGHAPPPPVLITEQEVLLGTAVGATGSTGTGRRWTAVLRRWRSAQAGEQRAPRRHYPPQRRSYFEHAAMAREMERL